jgi:hypothetical protein
MNERTIVLKWGTDKASAVRRAMATVGNEAAFEIRRGMVRLGKTVSWSLSGGDEDGWLVHYEVEYRNRQYFRSEEAVAS